MHDGDHIYGPFMNDEDDHPLWPLVASGSFVRVQAPPYILPWWWTPRKEIDCTSSNDIFNYQQLLVKGAHQARGRLVN